MLSGSAGLKAAAFLDGYTPSAVTSAGFVIGAPSPVLAPIGDKTVTEEQTISFTVTASETGSGTPTLSADLSDLPVGAAFSPSAPARVYSAGRRRPAMPEQSLRPHVHGERIR